MICRARRGGPRTARGSKRTSAAGVRREVIDRLLLTLGQEPVRLRPDRDHDSAEDVVLRVAGPVAGREHRLVRSVSTVGAVLEEQLVEPGAASAPYGRRPRTWCRCAERG